VISSGYGSPTPQAWERRSRSCSSPVSSSGIDAIDEAAEARVDAVGVLLRSVRRALDECTGRPHLVARGVREPGRGTLNGDGPDIGDGQIVAGEADRGALRHATSLALWTNGFGVRRHALRPRERLDHRPHELEACSREPLHGHRLEKGLEPEPAGRASPAAGGKHMVPSGRVVAGRDRRKVADEDRAGIAYPRRERRGFTEQDEMLGSGAVDLDECSLEIAAIDDSTHTVPSPCSAWAATSRSAASASPPLPSTTSTSDGPAGRSIATSRETSSFASFT